MSTDLAVIEAALEAATPGPWETDIDDWDCAVVRPDPGPGVVYICKDIHQGKDEGESDAYLIANAPAWLAELVERVKAAEAEVERMRSGSRCPQCSATEWGESGRQRKRAETVEAAIARVRKVADELLQPSYLFPEGQRGVVHKILGALEGGSDKRG